MAFEIKQSLKLSQQLVMSPQLQQAIRLLQLNRQDLVQAVNQELMENPLLEDAEKSESASFESASWDAYMKEHSFSSSRGKSLEDLPQIENMLVQQTSLEEHLFWQLSMSDLAPEEKNIAKLIIAYLNEDGYFKADLLELGKQGGIVDLNVLENILSVVQHLDPLGIGSRSVSECLLIQAKIHEPRNLIAEEIIENHFDLLQKKAFLLISKQLYCSIEVVQDAYHFILDLESRPASRFESAQPQYMTPDIFIVRSGKDFHIVLNEDGLPKLQISSLYQNILKAEKEDSKITKEYVKEKLKSAVWFIKAIHNRQKTIHKVTQTILNRQMDFFEKGVQYLKPMVLKDVAVDIGMHESTISRVTSNKYVHTPLGVFELRYFFNSSVHATDGGEDIASESVKIKIKEFIQHEDPKHPVSDEKIAQHLQVHKIHIARRTVTKYREALGILSSTKRKSVI
jgi:RNA polymerase sigma-54 factor